MTGIRDRNARSRHSTARARRGRAIPLDVLQALRENQRLLREITSGYHMPRADRPAACARWADADAPTISCPSDVATLLGDEMSTLVQEQLRILLLDSKNRMLGCAVIYQGTVHSISIRAAEVLRPAVLANAPALIIVHNHPSGDPSPRRRM
jgi:DNA repair protein RadC